MQVLDVEHRVEARNEMMASSLDGTYEDSGGAGENGDEEYLGSSGDEECERMTAAEVLEKLEEVGD